MLDDLFKAETIVMKERKKRSDEDSGNSEDEVEDNDGYLNTERVGVIKKFILILQMFLNRKFCPTIKCKY